VQSKAIPLALQGKDLLVRARTGSGKTAAFSLPLLHKILLKKSQDPDTAPAIRAVVRQHLPDSISRSASLLDPGNAWFPLLSGLGTCQASLCKLLAGASARACVWRSVMMFHHISLIMHRSASVTCDAPWSMASTHICHKLTSPRGRQILVPTRELCDQTYRHILELCYYCRDVITVQVWSFARVGAEPFVCSTRALGVHH
jgi:hypothetical protein